MKLSAAVLKALVLGVLVGGVAAVTPGCGPMRRPVTCNASNCPGCCDESAQCFTGLADVACGNAGTTCMACAMGQTCVASTSGSDAGTGGRCLSGGSTGGGTAGGSTGGGSAGGSTAGGSAGGGTGGGAATCNAQNCPNGCCTATGSCQNPGTTARCGTGGAACMACPSRQTCVAGACTACPGCVDLATGRCEMGSTDNLCGKSGDFCANCTVSNGACTNQICTGNMSGCNATNCANGCCDQGSGMCVEPAAQSGQQCGQGVGASLCSQCPSNMCATNDAGIGQCVGGNTGGGGAGGGFPGLDGGLFPMGCDGVTMLCAPTECCLTALGTCVGIGQGLPPLLTACGVNGGVCATCTFPRTCNMSSGMCQ
ncbi:MAG: hypothetical protein Q8S33_06085 [Myxococcales bacterium]|nr:hypothetical protein [Myxococcales bacterium]